MPRQPSRTDLSGCRNHSDRRRLYRWHRRYMQRVPNSGVRYFHKVNAGQAAARNVGIELANGKYLAFCDADDMYHPEALSIMSAGIIEADIVISSFSQSSLCPAENESSFKVYIPYQAIKETLYQRKVFHPSAWAKLYKKKLFDDVRFVDGLYYEDLEIMPRLYAKCERIAVSDSKLYFYREESVELHQHLASAQARYAQSDRKSFRFHKIRVSRSYSRCPEPPLQRLLQYFCRSHPP